MKTTQSRWAILFGLGLSLGACEARLPESSKPLVTVVDHTEVKRQAIGNCWIYAAATWLESLLKTSTTQEINVSETYWTYWDFYEKIRDGEGLDEEGKFPTGGHWWSVKHLIKRYGWVAQEDFQTAEEDPQHRSDMQACAERDIVPELEEGGRLFRPEQRTEAAVREVLDDVFSCQGRYPLDWNRIRAASHSAVLTQLKLPGSTRRSSLAEQLQAWQVVANPAYEAETLGKGLLSRPNRERLDALSVRIRHALNDHQPVILSFQVSFEAPDEAGVFNLDTLAERGSMGHQGGHMIVLHDYTVSDVPGIGYLGEGDLSLEQKAAALSGQLDVFVAKNSWGRHRWDRPWLGEGYSRFTWDYLSARYYDEKLGGFVPFLQNAVLPAGY